LAQWPGVVLDATVPEVQGVDQAVSPVL
jgi:hypothetical protein